MNTADKKKALDIVAREIAETLGGPLKAPGINPVPGEGNPDAQIMFIGEAPGFNENREGRPFIGQAGKLLRKNLASNGFKEADVYITNIVKFRPPENRDPTPSEIEFFRPFLDRQIEIIEPKIIVTLGRYSMYKFLGEGASISRIHGITKEIDWQGRKITIFPMYHPAAALRAGSMMGQFERDFSKLKDNIYRQAAGTAINSTDENTKTTKTDSKQLELI